jgi:hypothetical protein
MSFSNTIEIKNFIKERERTRLETFQEIYQECLVKIEKAVLTDNYYCQFAVPINILGKPRYQLRHCLQYIIIMLRKSGFETKYVEPNYIIVSWIKSKDDAYDEVIESIQVSAPVMAQPLITNSPYTARRQQSKQTPPQNFQHINKDDFEIVFSKDKKKLSDSDKKFKAINNFLPRTNILKNFNK